MITTAETTVKTQKPQLKPISETTNLPQIDDVEQKILALLAKSVLSIDQVADFIAVSVS